MSVQEEVNEKTVALMIRGGKISAEVLKAALLKLLRRLEEERREHRSEKRTEKRVQAAEKQQAKRLGKKTLEEMMAEGSELSNIEITDQNIRSFEKVARKFHIDYRLKKDRSVDPPKYLVFFRARDVDVMTAAFREYTGISLQKNRKVSIQKQLHQALQRAAKHRERQKVRTKDRGQQR